MSVTPVVTFRWFKGDAIGCCRLNGKFKVEAAAAALEAFVKGLATQLERQGAKDVDFYYLMGLASVKHSKWLWSPRWVRPRRTRRVSGNGHAGRRPAAE